MSQAYYDPSKKQNFNKFIETLKKKTFKLEPRMQIK